MKNFNEEKESAYHQHIALDIIENNGHQVSALS